MSHWGVPGARGAQSTRWSMISQVLYIVSFTCKYTRALTFENSCQDPLAWMPSCRRSRSLRRIPLAAQRRPNLEKAATPRSMPVFRKTQTGKPKKNSTEKWVRYKKVVPHHFSVLELFRDLLCATPVLINIFPPKEKSAIFFPQNVF